MENFDLDLRSIQEARNLARQGSEAAKKMKTPAQWAQFVKDVVYKL